MALKNRNFVTELIEACRRLSDNDPELGQAIEKIRQAKADISWTASENSGLVAVVRAIISQLLSRHAAQSIYARLVERCNGSITAQNLLVCAQDGWESVGLSNAKKNTLQSLAQAISEGKVDLDQLATKDAEHVRQTLTGFKGIGSWTVDMYLLFFVRSLDILPVKDVGIWRGAKIAYDLPDYPSQQWLEEKRLVWTPYCSIASLYLWRRLHIEEEAQKHLKAKNQKTKQTRKKV